MIRLAVFLTRTMSLEKWAQGGVLERELAVYEAFVARGARVTFVSWGGCGDARHVAGRPGMDVAANTLNLPERTYEMLMPVLHAGVFLRTDLIKTNQMNGADAALRCARLWRTPLVARCGFMWSEFREKQQLYTERGRALQIERDAYTHAAQGIVTTEAMREYLVRMGIERDKLAVVPNYVVDAFFDQPAVSANPKPVILAVGRLAEQKNYESLFAACAGLDVRLRVIGQGHLSDALREQAARLDLDVEWVGQVPHDTLPAEMAAADIYAQVSLYEGHPKSLLEAMACGASIVSTDVPGIRGVVEDGKTGLLCGTDATSIRTGLETLLADRALAEKLGVAARESARASCSVTTVADMEWGLYRTIVKGRE